MPEHRLKEIKKAKKHPVLWILPLILITVASLAFCVWSHLSADRRYNSAVSAWKAGDLKTAADMLTGADQDARVRELLTAVTAEYEAGIRSEEAEKLWAEADSRARAVEEEHQRAEADARAEAAEEAALKAEADAAAKAEEDAKFAAEHEARVKAEEAAKQANEELALLKAAE
ncbi:MAG: hypothetical protein MJ142_06880, partial [Clostridia bacterium]|nr:hypothetical protein [Clostridia bacterium]